MPDNPDELFDIVDSSDRVIGSARRADVHANGLMHRAVHVILSRANGDVFLQKRSMDKDCHPGTWDSSASGHLDSGEEYLNAAIRELKEELGVEIQQLRQIGALDACDMTGQEFVRIYHAMHDGSFTLHPTEIEEGRWVDIAGLEKWLIEKPEDFAPCFRHIWEHAGRPVLGH